MSVPFALVDAFTDKPFSGNTAGVVTMADGLTAEQMQQIARELRQTETCFVSSGEAPGTDFALRWFTPTVEVDLCGHATVAAFVCLAEEGRITWREGRAQARCAIRTGAIDVWLEQQGDRPPVVMLAVGVASLEAASDDLSEVAEAVGLAASAIDRSLPLAKDAASARLIIPVTRLADLVALTPNALGMVAYGEQTGYRRFTLLCRETEDPASFVHLRHFAPANGIPEDPVTGTAHAVAAVYLDRQGLLPGGECVNLTGEQGHAVGRHGVVEVEVQRQDGQIVDVRIGGSATVVARGEITS
jgi:trans-2,3-dihydro-3-hydroxyanthranilate isomerase